MSNKKEEKDPIDCITDEELQEWYPNSKDYAVVKKWFWGYQRQSMLSFIWRKFKNEILEEAYRLEAKDSGLPQVI